MRSTSSWLVGALAAVATIMLAGSQLSSVGSLTWEDDRTRLLLAVGSAVVAVVAVAYAVSRLSAVQMPSEGTLVTVREMLAPGRRGRRSRFSTLVDGDSGLRSGYPTVEILLEEYERRRRAEHRRDLVVRRLECRLEGTRSPSEAREVGAALETARDRRKKASEAVGELRSHVQTLVQLASYLSLRATYEQARPHVLGAALATAAALIAFAWAANPPEATQESADALPQNPRAGTLFLSEESAQQLSAVLGGDCAAEASGEAGIGVVALASTDGEIDVVTVPTSACPMPVKLTVTDDVGRVVPADAVPLS